MEEEISHDKLFKTVFRVFLKSLMELVYPELAETLNLEHPKFLSKDLFSDFRKQGHLEPDLIAEATTRKGNPQLVLLHLEVESTFRNNIDQRMRRYAMHLALATEKPVISMVVFLKGGLGGLEIREVSERVGPLEIWRFRYLAFGLSQSRAEDFVNRPQPLAAALAALMRSEIWDRVEQKLHCLQAIACAKGLGVDQQYVLAKVVNSYLRLNKVEEQQFAVQLKLDTSKEVQNMVVTWKEALAASKAEGQAAGQAVGQAKGRVEATQEAILRLAKRFNLPVPPDFEEKLQAISDFDRLQGILESLFENRSLEDLTVDSTDS